MRNFQNTFERRRQSFISTFSIFMTAPLNLNYIIIDQSKLLTVFRSVLISECANVKFKETNQICSPLKISQSINAE